MPRLQLTFSGVGAPDYRAWGLGIGRPDRSGRRIHMKRLLAPGFVCLVLGFAFVSSPVQAQRQPMNYDGNPGGVRYLEEGQRPVVVYPTVEAARHARASGVAGTANNLT